MRGRRAVGDVVAAADPRLQFSLVLSSAFMSACVHFGLGKHGRFISPDDLPSLLFFSYLAGFFTILSATWTKSSFAITLLSISEGWTRRVVWFMLVSVNLVLGLIALLQWVRCWPVETLWDVGVGVTGHCWFSFAQLRTYNTVSAVYSGTADIAFAVLPWKIIWHAKICKNEKFGALFAMSIGVLYVSACQRHEAGLLIPPPVLALHPS